VRKRDSGQLYAMKYMSKAQCRLRDALKNVLREVEILASLDHPFLVNLWFSFQGKAILTNNALLTAIQFTRFTQAAAQPTFRPGAGDLSQRNFHLFSYRDFSLSLVVTFAAGCCCDIERSLCFSSRMIGPHSKKSCV
jgi:serine/threonine protein kinase